MAFGYGSQNRFYDQIIQAGVSATGDFGPVIAGGDVNGALAIVVTCATSAVVSAMTLTYKESETESGVYAAPKDVNTVKFGGSAYAAGDEVGSLILPNGCKDYIKATIGGTITSGKFDIQLQYLAR